MMLLEDQGKRIFRDRGITVPSGRTVTSPDEVEVDGAVMIKALVPAGGRGKAGGISRASNLEEARAAAAAILGSTISGHAVRAALVEEALPVAREMYMSIIIDRSAGIPVLITSRFGGVDIESLDDSKLRRWTLHPFLRVPRYVAREAVASLELEDRVDELHDLLEKLWSVFLGLECELLEINPLILTTNGELVAADAKVVVNDDALFRHPEIPGPSGPEDDLERTAGAVGITFLRLDGDIGVIANGAGLTMATMDALSARGGRAGAFMDLGGTDDPSRVRRAYEIMARSEQKVILVNIFGGMTKCDTVAQGLLDALSGMTSPPLTVVRLRGINEEKAREMLLAAGVQATAGLEDAVREAVALKEGI